MPVRLRWLDRTTLPVDAEALSPRAVAGLSGAAVARLTLRVGNAQTPVGELFAVADDPEAGTADGLTIEGDLTHVRRLGAGMDSGTLEIRGDVGPYLGEGMTGGTIRVIGSASHWAGAEMRGGVLRILGDAGDGLGAARPGSRLGMRDGVILVDGRAGEDVGRAMRRGVIAVRGGAGEGFGSDLIAGTLISLGPVGRDVGVGMKRGTVVLAGRDAPDLPATFAPSGWHVFPFMTVYLRRLAAWGFETPAALSSDRFRRYNGDLAGGGQGEILVPPAGFEG